MKKPVQSSELFFFRQEETSYLSVSKLLWFKPNRKNGRHLIYDSESHKCIPIYRCEGCLKNFEVASALGGHLSSCDFKKLHSKYLKETKFIKKVEPMEFTSFEFITDQKQKLRSNTKHSDPGISVFKLRASRAKETIRKWSLFGEQIWEWQIKEEDWQESKKREFSDCKKEEKNGISTQSDQT